MKKTTKSETDLANVLVHAREKGYFDASKYSNGKTLWELLGYPNAPTPNEVRSALIKIFVDKITNPIERDVLLMAFGLLQGYQDEKAVGKRRELCLRSSQYFEKCRNYKLYLKSNYDAEKIDILDKEIDNLGRYETRIINRLAPIINKISNLHMYIAENNEYLSGRKPYAVSLPEPSSILGIIPGRDLFPTRTAIHSEEQNDTEVVSPSVIIEDTEASMPKNQVVSFPVDIVKAKELNWRFLHHRLVRRIVIVALALIILAYWYGTRTPVNQAQPQVQEINFVVNVYGDNTYYSTSQLPNDELYAALYQRAVISDAVSLVQDKPLVVNANPTIIVSARAEGVSGDYKNRIDVKPGDIVDVQAVVRNTTGQNLSLAIRTSLSDELDYIDGSAQIYNAVNEGASLDDAFVTGWKNLGVHNLYNANTGEGESVITYKVRVPDAVETDLEGKGVINFANLVTCMNDEGEVITDTIYQNVSLSVDFGEQENSSGTQLIQMALGVHKDNEDMFIRRVDANRGDEVLVQLSFENISAEKMDILGSITLPDALELIPGSVVGYNASAPDGVPLSDDIFNGFSNLGECSSSDEESRSGQGSVSFRVRVAADEALFVPGVNTFNILSQVAGYQDGQRETDIFYTYAAVDVTLNE